jgi:CBS domain-containing protein
MILSVARRQVVTAAPEDEVKDAAGLMEYYNVGCVVVVKKDKPVGILTDRDLALRCLLKGGAQVGDVMTAGPQTIREDEGFDRAIELMNQSGVRRLPVVDRKGRLRGIVSQDDLIETLGQNLHRLAATVNRQQKGPQKAAARPKPQPAAVDRNTVF